MDVFAELKRRVARHPALRVDAREDAIEVFPEGDSTFPVALLREGNRFLVHFAGWYERFDSAREALDCVSYGLFGACRLRVWYRGETAHRWALEEERQGDWREHSRQSLRWFPFWKPVHVRVLENRLRPGDS
ncbi:MAG: hypothetical protein AAF430_17995 [Myxococcota bacterium]